MPACVHQGFLPTKTLPLRHPPADTPHTQVPSVDLNGLGSDLSRAEGAVDELSLVVQVRGMRVITWLRALTKRQIPEIRQLPPALWSRRPCPRTGILPGSWLNKLCGVWLIRGQQVKEGGSWVCGAFGVEGGRVSGARDGSSLKLHEFLTLSP